MDLRFFVWLLVPVLGLPFKADEDDQCGYLSCPADLSPDDLNVHIIAHSHDDVGWLKTVDQYYYGSKSNIQVAGVQYILTSVVQALLANPKRRFIQVETDFFHKWWKEQSPQRQDDVRKLIKNGQLQIAGGGWSMNDEAAAHYQSIIDQMTFGIKYMEDTLGECARPKVGWQIDPFGHTREMASILAQMGYDGLFFARLDWRDKKERLTTKTAEMLWRGSANLGLDSLLFTHAMYNHYSPPLGFYFDVLSQDDPLISDENSTEYNLGSKIKTFNELMVDQSNYYSSNNIMVAMGNDFTYQDAHYNFKNLDILIKAYEITEQRDEQGRRIKLFYSTPDCYLKAVNDVNLNYKVKTDDFIPYASDYHSYWSGYYTSRPTQKRFERQGNNFLQMAKQLHVFSGRDASGSLTDLKDAMGVMQHHDAITGTEKQHVADDYARNFMKILASSHVDMDSIIKNLLKKTSTLPSLSFESCLLANVSICEQSQKDRFVVSLYNPLSRKVSHHVRVPVNSLNFKVQDPNGDDVKWQIVPSISDFKEMHNIKPSKYDLVFLAENLPALGIRLYYVTRLDDSSIQPPQTVTDTNIGDDNNFVKLSPLTNLPIQFGLNGLKLDIEQELMYYIGAQNNNMVFENRSSGAYIFRPDPEHPDAIKFIDKLDTVSVYKGSIVDEIHQVFNEWNRQIIRVYKHNQNYIEFDWLVGPIDIEEGISKEIISRFTSSLNSNEFYTDSNGRETLLRRNNYRPTYPFSVNESVAGNYFPITSAISLRDTTRRVELAVLTDRAQGGASLDKGMLELMVHRRLLKDDAFGVSEALDEQEFGKGLVVRGQHYLTFGSTNTDDEYPFTRKLQRDIAQKKILAPWMFVADASGTENELSKLQEILNFEFSGLKRDLPEEVQILTLEPWNHNTVLMRFEHILEKQDYGTVQKIDVEGLFNLFKVTDMTETTLAGTAKKSKLKWNKDGCLASETECDVEPSEYNQLNQFKFDLNPMQIRTFVVTVEF